MNGDATGLDDALENVHKKIRLTEASLRDVNRLLKLDPTNTELLSQKHRLLQQEIDDTKVKLQALKTADVQAKMQLEKGELGQDKYDDLQRVLIETQQKLNSLESQSEKCASALKDIAEKADGSFKSANKSLLTLGENADKVGKKLSAAGEATEPLSKGAAALAAAAVATVPATQELRTDLSKLDNNARSAGVGIDVARQAFELFNVVSDEVDSSIEATANLMQAGFTESNLQKAVEGLTGAYLRFPDTLKIESLADSLQETLATSAATGQFGELLDRLGIGAESFSEGLAKCTTEAEKQNYALKVLADAGMYETYEAYMKNNEALIESKQATYEFQEATAELAETIEPILTKVTQIATQLIETFNEMSPTAQKVVMAIIAIVAALSPILTMAGKAASSISSLTTSLSSLTGATSITGVLSKAFAALTGPVGILVGLVTALIAAFATLMIKNEEFRENIIGIWTQITETFQTFTQGIVERINALGFDFGSFTEMLAAAWNGLCEILAPVFEGAFSMVAASFTEFTGILTGLLDIFISLFTGDWDQAWNGIKEIFSSIWTFIVSQFSIIANTLKNILNVFLGWAGTSWSQVWNNVKSAAMEIWNSLSSNAKVAFQNLVDGIKSKLSGISEFITSAFDDAIAFITSLPSKALQWGRDFIDGLIKGIQQKISAVISTVKNLASEITSYIHFSRPDKGPLHYYEEWMPDMMEGLAEGIVKNIPLIQKAVNSVASVMSSGVQSFDFDYAQMGDSVGKAVRNNNGESKLVAVIDSRSFKRGLENLGVVFE